MNLGDPAFWWTQAGVALATLPIFLVLAVRAFRSRAEHGLVLASALAIMATGAALAAAGQANGDLALASLGGIVHRGTLLVSAVYLISEGPLSRGPDGT